MRQGALGSMDVIEDLVGEAFRGAFELLLQRWFPPRKAGPDELPWRELRARNRGIYWLAACAAFLSFVPVFLLLRAALFHGDTLGLCAAIVSFCGIPVLVSVALIVLMTLPRGGYARVRESCRYQELHDRLHIRLIGALVICLAVLGVVGLLVLLVTGQFPRFGAY